MTTLCHFTTIFSAKEWTYIKFYCFFLGNGEADSEEHFLATYELLSNEMSFWLAFFGMLHGSVFEWHSKSELLNHTKQTRMVAIFFFVCSSFIFECLRPLLKQRSYHKTEPFKTRLFKHLDFGCTVGLWYLTIQNL